MVYARTARRSRITPERRDELFGAVLELLREVGYNALTMGAVAARTRSSKATLYRLWGGKAELVLTAVRHNKPAVSIAEVDTGSLRSDLHAIVLRLDNQQMEQHSALLRALAMEGYEHPDLLLAAKEHIFEPEIADFRRVLERAVDRGEIRPGNPAIDFVRHMITDSFVARSLLDHRPPTQAFVLAYIDAVMLPALQD